MASPAYSLTTPFKVFKGAPSSIPDTNSMEALLLWLDAQQGNSSPSTGYKDLEQMVSRAQALYSSYKPGVNLRSIKAWSGSWSLGVQDNIITARVMYETENGGWVAKLSSNFPAASNVTVRVVCSAGQPGSGVYDHILMTSVILPIGSSEAMAPVNGVSSLEVDTDSVYIDWITPLEDSSYEYKNGSAKTV